MFCLRSPAQVAELIVTVVVDTVDRSLWEGLVSQVQLYVGDVVRTPVWIISVPARAHLDTSSAVVFEGGGAGD